MSLNDATARPHTLFFVLKAKMPNFTAVQRWTAIAAAIIPRIAVTGWAVVHAQAAASDSGYFNTPRSAVQLNNNSLSYVTIWHIKES
jgi:hypothetical protein